MRAAPGNTLDRAFILLFVCVLAFAGSHATGEEATGTLEGTVRRTDSSPIAGADVSATGPRGTLSRVTGARGRFLIRGVSPGTYDVSASAPGFAAFAHRGVRASIGRRTQLVFELSSEAGETNAGRASAVHSDIRSSAVGKSVAVHEFARRVPLGLGIESVFTVGPGVADARGRVLGSANPSISGSSGLENAYYVDGVNVTHSGYGALGAFSQRYGALGIGATTELLEEVRVETGGFDAGLGQAGGGIVNAAVRSGTNRFSLDLGWYEEPTTFEGAHGDRLDSPNIANEIESLRRDLFVTAGGPILQDRLFYFVAYDRVAVEQDFKLTSGDADQPYDLDGDGVATDLFDVGDTIAGGRTPPSVTRERTIDNYAGKLSWFANRNHKLELTIFGDPSDGNEGPQDPLTFLRGLTDPIGLPDPNARATGLDWGGDQLSLGYQGAWNPRFFTEVRLFDKSNELSESGAALSRYRIFDLDNNVATGGPGPVEDQADDVEGWSFENTHLMGPVELSYGWQQEKIEWFESEVRSGPVFASYFPNLLEDGAGATGFVPSCTDPTFDVGGSPNDPDCYTTVQSTSGASLSATGLATPDPSDNLYHVTSADLLDPRQSTASEKRNAFVQVMWDAPRGVTLRAGLRWTEQDITGAGGGTLPIGSLSIGGPVTGDLSTTLTPQSYAFDGEIAPRLGLTWDVTGNGRNKLYAGWGEYYQTIPNLLALRAFSNRVGITDESFRDAVLRLPDLNGSCGVDTDGDGLFDATVPCHQPTGVQGLQSRESLILDGTQQDPGSDVYANLGSWRTLATREATALPYTKEWLGGYAREVNDHIGFELRYIHRNLGRVLDDLQFASNEQLWNLFRGVSGGQTAFGDPFPGHGVGGFGTYVLANPGDNVDTRLFPRPARDYDAWELVFNRRLHHGWTAYANYRFARLEGNYEGWFRNDNGCICPGLGDQFDFPAASALDLDGDGTFETIVTSETMAGQYLSGPLNTERHHVFNGFVSHQFDFGLNLGGRLTVQSGQPRGPLYAHPAYSAPGQIPGFDPVYWWTVSVDVDNDGVGDGQGFVTDPDPTIDVTTRQEDFDGDGSLDTIVGVASSARLFAYDAVERDFSGHTPSIVTADLHASYDVGLRDGKSRLTLLLDIFNLFDDNGAVSYDDAVELRPGSTNPDYRKANRFQEPRNVRIGARFTW